MSAPGRRVRDRDVLLVMGVIVVVVLATELLSAAVPEVERLLAGVPVVVAGLLVGTAAVLLHALRTR